VRAGRRSGEACGHLVIDRGVEADGGGASAALVRLGHEEKEQIVFPKPYAAIPGILQWRLSTADET
jgi:hypothetical protein